MDFRARFIREHYLQLEEQEARPLACGGESPIDGHVALERAHAAALRENAARLGSPKGTPHDETSEQAERATLGRSLVASIAIAGIRYEITPRGREALQSALTFRSKDATGSEPASGYNGSHG